MTEEIDLLELFQLLLKKKWWILSATIAGAILGVVMTMLVVTPLYESNTTLMVNSRKSSGIGDIASSIDLGSLNLSQKLVVTYSEIVKSRIVLEQVIDKLELPTTYEKLLGTVTSKPVGTTEILKITVQHPDPEQAARIANKISDVFVKEVMRILKVDNVETIDVAIPLLHPVNYSPVRNGAIGAMLLFMLACGIVFLLSMLDRTIKTADDVRKHLDMPVIGSVIDFNKAKAPSDKGFYGTKRNSASKHSVDGSQPAGAGKRAAAKVCREEKA